MNQRLLTLILSFHNLLYGLQN